MMDDAMSNLKSHGVGGNFDHPIPYSIACTIKSDKVFKMGHERISFRSLVGVINEDVLECLW